MHDEFDLPVFFKNEQHNFPARLLSYGYSYKLEVEIDETKVLFEPDEEKNWRAILPPEEINTNKKITIELLQAISGSIEEILK